jgi:hypothetical protein
MIERLGPSFVSHPNGARYPADLATGFLPCSLRGAFTIKISD